MTEPGSAIAGRLVAAFAEPGCPVCRCLEADSRRNLTAVLREMTMDPAGRAGLRASGGFCAWHASLLREAADGILSVVLLAEDLLGVDLARRVACSACIALRDRARAYLLTLPDLPAVVREGPGLPCRPHLRALRAVVADTTGIARLEQATADRVARLRAELGEFIAKQDYRRADPPTPEEARAWREALEHLAGRPAIFGSELGRP